MKKKTLLILLVIVMIPSVSFARDRKWKAGLMMGPSVILVDDPAGSTEIETSLSFLNGIVTLPARRDTRIFIHLFYEDFNLNNTGNKVSGSIKSLGLNTSYQWRYRHSRSWKPWFGVGLGFSQDEFKSRALLDSGGFIVQDLPDREDNAINLLLNASTQLKQWWMLDFGVHGQIDIPISGDITRFMILGTILY